MWGGNHYIILFYLFKQCLIQFCNLSPNYILKIDKVCVGGGGGVFPRLGYITTQLLNQHASDFFKEHPQPLL